MAEIPGKPPRPVIGGYTAKNMKLAGFIMANRT